MASPDTAPRFLRPQDLKRLQNFAFASRLVVEGFYAGRHRSPFHDASAEFADYRPYVPGDEVRALDWRAYARTDRDYVKQFRKETDLRCHILLDCSRSMAFRDEEVFGVEAERGGAAGAERRNFIGTQGAKAPGAGRNSPRWFRGWGNRSRLLTGDAQTAPIASPENASLTKFEYGAFLAGALGYLIIRQGDKAGLALGGSELRAYTPPGGTIAHLHRLLHTLEQMEPDGPTRLANVLHTLFAVAPRRGLLIVISDFLEEPEPLFGALARFAARGWQTLLLHVLTRTELELPGAHGPQRYLDAESVEMADLDPDALRAPYLAEINAWLETLSAQAKARALHYARMTTDTPYNLALERYLATRG